MTTRKAAEAASPEVSGAVEAAKPQAIRNNYHSPLQLGDGTIIPAGASVATQNMEVLAKNQTVAAWLKAGVLEVI